MHKLARPVAPQEWQPAVDDYVRTDQVRANRKEKDRWKGFCREKQAAYDQAKEVLAKNQNNLCAYCEILMGDTNHQIEHIVPKKSSTPENDLTFQFSNFLFCCKGGSSPHCADDGAYDDNPRRSMNISCGQSKGDTQPDDTLIIPFDCPDIPIFKKTLNKYGIAFEPNQENCGKAGIPVDLVFSTIEILNLNCPRLCRARTKLWEKIISRKERTLNGRKLSKRKKNKALKKGMIILHKYVLNELQPTNAFYTTVLLCFAEELPDLVPSELL